MITGLVLSACGDSSSGEGGASAGGAAPGGAAPGGAGGEATAGADQGGSGSASCTNGRGAVGNCKKADETACAQYPEPYTVDTVQQTCGATGADYQAGPCDRSADDFLGCCEQAYPNASLCYYDQAAQAPNYEQSCNAIGGTWCP